jgi:hypothetical protein
MVDYVGDMMKPYQNCVDRIQGGGLHRYATYNKKFPVFSVFISINERTAQTAGAILMVNGSKDVVWRKDVPFGVRIILSRVLVVKSPKTHNYLAGIGNSHYKVAKRQGAITFEPINGNE